MSLLQVTNLESGYGSLPVLHGVSMRVEPEEIVAVIGPNGAGKSTLMKTIFRLLPAQGGSVEFDGVDLSSRSATKLADLGMGFAPQGFSTFPELTVEDNLKVSLTSQRRKGKSGATAKMYETFPILGERRRQRASTLSGGERQMLALASAMILEPRFLALDEPTTGLAPSVVDTLVEQIVSFRDAGTTILWVIEENPFEVLQYVDRVYLLQAGVFEREMPAKDLLEDESLRELFFGTDADADSPAEDQPAPA